MWGKKPKAIQMDVTRFLDMDLLKIIAGVPFAGEEKELFSWASLPLKDFCYNTRLREVEGLRLQSAILFTTRKLLALANEKSQTEKVSDGLPEKSAKKRKGINKKNIRINHKAKIALKLVKIKTPEDVWKEAKGLMDLPIENFRVLYLNQELELIENYLAAQGESDRTDIPAVPIYHRFEFLNAKYMWFVHNHPSGSLEPSQFDYDATVKLKTILADKMLGHLIVTPEGYRVI